MNESIRKQLAPLQTGLRKACWKKTWYRTKERAQRCADKRMAEPDCTDKLYVYQCPICRNWHITKMEQPPC